MKNKICPECGQEINDSKSDQAERKMVTLSLRLIQGSVPTLKGDLEANKNTCYACFKKNMLVVCDPLLASVVGARKKAAEATQAQDPAIAGPGKDS